MRKKLSVRRNMSSNQAVRDEMQVKTSLLMGQGPRKVGFWRASRATGLSTSVVQRLFYGKTKVVAASVADAVRAALLKFEERQDAAARNEFAILKYRLQALEAALSERDPDFHSPDIDALRDSTRNLGRMDRSVD